MSCMHAFYIKNLGIVIIVIACTIVSEILLAMFGWKILRPWAMRRLDKISKRAHATSGGAVARSKNWNVVVAFSMPETEEDIVRKETAVVTDTWYFEGTVIGCVTLSMYVLAMQSPTVPPPEDEVLALRSAKIINFH